MYHGQKYPVYPPHPILVYVLYIIVLLQRTLKSRYDNRNKRDRGIKTCDL